MLKCKHLPLCLLSVEVADTTMLVNGILPAGNPVMGIASVDNELFVLRRGNIYIEVYDTNSFLLRRTVKLTSEYTEDMRALTSCTTNKCIYVSEWERQTIYRIFVSPAVRVSMWTMSDWPRGLSVNKANNLLATCSYASEGSILEFTNQGILVRRIKLQPDVTIPVHAIQINRGLFVVCHLGCDIHRVCIVNGDGHVINSAGRNYGSDIGQFYAPRCLAVGRNESVIVADEKNNRLVLLNADLRWSRCLTSAGSGLSGPVSLHLDASQDGLYVREWEGGRVLVYDNVSFN